MYVASFNEGKRNNRAVILQIEIDTEVEYDVIYFRK